MKNFAHLKPESPWYPLFERGMAPIKNIFVLAKVHCVPVAEVKKGIEEQGSLPLRAIHVSSVSADLRAFI